jgi:hypothetical protein
MEVTYIFVGFKADGNMPVGELQKSKKSWPKKEIPVPWIYDPRSWYK